jgi:hypothetical protein
MKYVPLYLAAMMLLCLAPMPYGYFQLVRFVAMIVFGLMAYRYYQNQKMVATWVFGALALLFQPIYKIALGRVVWNVVDVIVAIFLIILFVFEWRREKGEYVKFETLPPDNDSPASDNRIEFSLKGKLDSDELLYIASEENAELTRLLESKPEIFEGWGQMIGFHIIYLPLLMKRLKDKEVVKYRAPYLTEAEIGKTAIDNDYLLQYLEHPSDRGKIKQGFIRTEDIRRGSDGKDKAINRFYPLSSNSSEPIADQLHRIGKQISIEKNEHERLLESRDSYDDWGNYEVHNAGDRFNSQISEENTDDLIEEVKERIAKLRQRGISQYILEQLIHPDDRLSRLVITKDYRIVLPDYQNMEIKMEPIVKAVYLLFLNHPEGITFKSLPGYREELADIYTKLRPTGMSDRAMQSIEDVTNPLLNSINEKCARIRGAFVGQFDDYMAKYYYIDGKRGEVKKIALPHDLVIWE